MTRFDPIDSDRARADAHHIWLTVMLSPEEQAAWFCTLMENHDDIRERILEITQRQFDEYTRTRSQE